MFVNGLKGYALLVIAVMGVLLMLVLITVAALLISQQQATVVPTEQAKAPCRVETAGAREVYDEANNLNTRVGAIEPGIYRVVAFSLDDWVSVDWALSGIQVDKEHLRFLDWIQLENGVDVLIGACNTVPRLGMRSALN